MWKQREWFEGDRHNDRLYDEARERDARNYNRMELEEARAYNRAEIDEARAYSRQALSQLVEDSQAAGFNPLTVLRGGGASSYNAGAGFAPLSSVPLTASTPSPSSTPMFTPPVKRAVGGGSGIGDAVSSIGDFLQNFDPFADDKREQEYRLVESQIASLNASALSGVARGAGSYASGDTDPRPSAVGASLAKPFSDSALGKPAKWEAGDVKVTNPFQTEPVDPNWSDAATWEQRYGEPGSWVGGAVVGAADAWDFANRKASAFTKPGGAVRNAARWVDKVLGTEKPKKAAKLSRPFTGGGGGW
ncbi:hypothetical protein GH789_05965 [Rhizobium pusense]|uniref:hypothetical protein n=1 Tax=Agrobacterium pusense TaxID=648995 RepID=UPI00129B7621|nr:hypothetical protein [Agrobacterium pusense]MRG64827.1 hypothetical protein [Agrobacterium pusense]